MTQAQKNKKNIQALANANTAKQSSFLTTIVWLSIGATTVYAVTQLAQYIASI